MVIPCAQIRNLRSFGEIQELTRTVTINFQFSLPRLTGIIMYNNNKINNTFHSDFCSLHQH